MSKKLKHETRLKVFNKYNGKCAYCGININLEKMHIDHIEPKYRGWNNEELIKYNKIKGLDDLNNYNPSCISCNCSKNTYSIDEWKIQILLKINRIRRDSSTFNILERFGIVKVVKKDFKFYFEESEVHNG
jgi:5-methylcytosine-specific restriction endonuclease McrA